MRFSGPKKARKCLMPLAFRPVASLVYGIHDGRYKTRTCGRGRKRPASAALSARFARSKLSQVRVQHFQQNEAPHLLVGCFVLVDDTRLELVTSNRARSALYREEPLEVPFIPPFIAPHWLQELHPPQAPQEAQLPPQELLPAFLSRIMPRISRATISTMTATSAILMRLADNQANIRSLP